MASSTDKQMAEEICDLRKDLKNYRPGKESKHVHGLEKVTFPEHLCIGLFGKTGCGKTSLINSLKFAISGSLKAGQWKSVATLEKAGGHTLRRVLAPLVRYMSVIDNRGFLDLTRDGTFKELTAQMDGKRGYSEMVEWERPEGEADEDYIIDVDSNDSISCAVFVFSARDSISDSTNGLHQVVHRLQEQQGQYPVAVITNVDCADRKRVEELTSILQVTGISEIFEVANITKEKTNLEISYQHNLLSLLATCMTIGEEAAVFKHYQRVEKMQKQERMEKVNRDKEEQIKNKQAEKNAADFMTLEEKKLAVASGAIMMGATGAGAAIGIVAGPVGSAIGAGVGAAVGGISLLIGKIIK